MSLTFNPKYCGISHFYCIRGKFLCGCIRTLIFLYFSLQRKRITHYAQGWNQQTDPQRQRQTEGNASAPLDSVGAFPYISLLINSSHNYFRWAAGGFVVTHHYGYTPVHHSFVGEVATPFLGRYTFNTRIIAIGDVDRQVPVWLGAVRRTDSIYTNNLTLWRSKVNHLFRTKKRRLITN